MIVLSSAGAARAQADSEQDRLDSKFAIDDADPERSVPTPEQALRMPLQMGYHIMLLSERAEAAAKHGDQVAAVRYWRALAKAAPDRSRPYSEICKAYQAAGELDEAIESCRTALGKAGTTVEDSLDFVKLLLSQKGELSASQIADVEAVAQHLEEQLTGEKGAVVANRLRCQLGTRLSDAVRLRACSQKLVQLAPNDAQTLVFTWTLAILNKNYAAAQVALQRAEELKLAPAALDQMRARLALERQRNEQRWQRALVQPSFLWIAVSALAFAALTALRAKRSKA